MKLEFTSRGKKCINNDIVLEHDWVRVTSGSSLIKFKENEQYKVTIEKQ